MNPRIPARLLVLGLLVCSLHASAAGPAPAALFEDPDKLLPLDPPVAKELNLKLAGFERSTGIKICVRLHAKFTPETPAQRPGNYAGSVARQLGLTQNGILAIYFADAGQWGLWIGDDHVGRFMGRAGTVKEFTKDGSFHRAKQDFLAAAKTSADLRSADAAKAAPPGQSVSDAQKIRFQVDAVLAALFVKFAPGP